MLREEGIIQLDELASKKNGTKSAHLKHIQEGLIGYLTLINALSKQKRVMRREKCKHQDILFKRFTARLTELNNYLTLFHGSSYTKNMPPEYLTKILLYDVPNGWAKQNYPQGWDFEGNTYKETCEIFECMEIPEQVYEVGTPSKITTHREYANLASHGRKHKGGESTLPTNPEKGRTGNQKKNYSGHPSDQTTSDRTYVLHDPDTPQRSVKYWRNTPTSTPRSGPKKRKNPSLDSNTSVVSPSSFTARCRKSTAWNPCYNNPK